MAKEDGAARTGDKVDALVIGAGPAGLMAADVLAEAGRAVVVADAMPSFGRKFLMAGKSGLNLTKAEPLDAFLASYPDAPDTLCRAISDFGPDRVTAWAENLGGSVFTGSTGRVFPEVMKASPLLRAWLRRLSGLGVDLRTRWRWRDWHERALLFDTPNGQAVLSPTFTIFALGGGSWKRLGSDGAWTGPFQKAGIDLRPFQPANVGFRVDWSPHMQPHFGAPVKATRLTAGGLCSRGEWVVTEHGMEGGGIYEISRPVREGAPLKVDLLPDLTQEKVAARLARPRGKTSLSNHLRRTLKLSPVARALLMEWGRPLPDDPTALASLMKALPTKTTGPLPMDGAISTAGGVAWDALDGFALKTRPDTYTAGEMLDWEAPTGGYLITACLATGRAAAKQALRDHPLE